MGYAAGAVSKCVWQDPTGGGPPDWVLRGETPTEAQYIQSGQRPAQRSTRLLKICLGPTRGVVEGGRWTWVIGTGRVCLVGCGYSVMPLLPVSVFFRGLTLP